MPSTNEGHWSNKAAREDEGKTSQRIAENINRDKWRRRALEAEEKSEVAFKRMGALERELNTTRSWGRGYYEAFHKIKQELEKERSKVAKWKVESEFLRENIKRANEEYERQGRELSRAHDALNQMPLSKPSGVNREEERRQIKQWEREYTGTSAGTITQNELRKIRETLEEIQEKYSHMFKSTDLRD